MIVSLIYLLIILFLIYKNNFFGLFKDETISSKTFSILFLLKALAIPAFYVVYKKMYGGLEKFDAGKFYSDATILNDYAKTDFFGYLKVLFGFQNEAPGTILFDNYLTNTDNWDNGRLKDFFYNDNRIVIRFHSLIHFIAFNSYHVHALFSCFLSFIGLSFLYKAIKEFFIGKELFVLLILCLLPALWFYTGAVLKEGLAIFVLGCLFFQIKNLFKRKFSINSILFLLFLLFISLLLKPYVLFFAAFYFTVFFIILHFSKIKYKSLVLISTIALIIFTLNSLSVIFKNKSLFEAAIWHQRVFSDASKGGIFLLDNEKFVRLEYDSTLVKKVIDKPNYYTIKQNSPYIYWEHSHQQDTLFASSNSDTISQYKLVYQLPKSGSNISLNSNSTNLFEISASSLYYSLFHPFFFNSKSMLQHLASLENLLIIISLIIIFIGIIQNKKEKFPAITFVLFAILLCLLIGLTTPNSGAIFRYRSPGVIFILLGALYYLPISKNTESKISN
ncbi:MAG: hypothetical protein Q7W45_07325 [Bacteroidota bacterium]|nr:hypothetical protein [Bacteroidota bacterium]MDP3143952.1 hypothetical protein [Bacteroidota bacterium]